MITNDSILKSDEEYTGMSLSESSNINFFDQSRYKSYHAQVFFILNVILCIAAKVVVDSSYFYDIANEFFENKLSLVDTTEMANSVSDDYYSLMSIKFLVNEYIRTKAYEVKLDTMNGEDPNVAQMKVRIEEKVATIENQFKLACEKI